MKKFLKIIATIAIVYFGGKIATLLLSAQGKHYNDPKTVEANTQQNGESSLNSQALQTAKAINSQLPKSVGPGTTLTKVEYEGKIFRMHYDLDNTAPFTDDQLPKYKLDAATMVCGGSMKTMSEGGIAFEFLYHYVKDGEAKQFDLSVPSDTCVKGISLR